MARYNDFPPYMTVAERREKAERTIKKLQKTIPDISPVHIEGRSIATTWWGKSWCDNLERYADYSNRIDRGRSYVRHGAVLDLRLTEGKVSALVQGSASEPYEVELTISPLSEKIWQEMISSCTGKISSLQELAEGKLPKELADLFMLKKKGLFPSPKEIKFDCDCPDGAHMCKHIAAVLYGIGSRLDEDSSLFFTMRNVKMSDLITSSIAEKSKDLMEKASSPESGRGRRSRRIVADTDLSSKFGVEIESNDN